MQNVATRKSETISFRTEPQLRRLLEAEAAKAERSVAAIINAALRARYARKLRAAGNGGAAGESHP